MVSFCKCTEYPKIYNNTYWGGFELKYNENESYKDIFENRNDFIKLYKIKKCVQIPRRNPVKRELEKIGQSNLDHVECYLTIDSKYAIISSPYGNHLDKLYLDNEWLIHKKMYNNSASTYLKFIDHP